MRRRRLIIIGLVVLNLILGAGIFLGPLGAQIIPLSGFRNCCQGNVCCFSCCYIVQNCSHDGDCLQN